MKTKTRDAVNAFIERNKHALLLLYFMIYLPWFGHLERTVTTHFHVIHVALDDYIPFCEYFIIPYFLWFGYVAWGLGYFYFKNKDEYFRLCTMLFTGMTIFLVISTIYPNGHYLRPIDDTSQYRGKENVPYVDSASAWDRENGRLNLFVLNRNEESEYSLTVDVRGFEGYRFVKQFEMYTDDLEASSSFDNPSLVLPKEKEDILFADGRLTTSLKPLSWNVLCFEKEEE